MLLSRRLLCITLAVVVTLAPTGAIAQNVPPAAPVGPPATIWHFLGFRQGSWMMRDAFLNSSGNFPGLERKPPLKKLSDPGLKEIDNAAIKKAQEIKAEEELAPQKIKAIKYLATLGCEKCYGGIEEAMLESLKDCTAEVRLETVQALGLIPNQRCPECDHDCCTEKITAQLAKIAYERDPERPDCWYEPSARVREEARRVLSICCAGGPPLIIEEGPPPPGPEPKPEPKPEPRGELGPAAARSATFRLPKPGSSTVWVQDGAQSQRSRQANPSLNRAADARANKPSLAESIRGIAGTSPPAKATPIRAPRQAAPTPAAPPIQTEIAKTEIAADDAQSSSRRMQPVSRLQQPATLRQSTTDQPTQTPVQKPRIESPSLAPANGAASAASAPTVRTLGLSQPRGLLPVVGIVPAHAIAGAAAPAKPAAQPATTASKPATETSVMRLASAPDNVSLSGVKRLPDANQIGPPPVPTVEQKQASSQPKAITYGTQGVVARVSPQGGTVEVKFPSGGVPRVGSRLQVHHQYLFKTGYIGELQVIASGAGVATAKPFDGLDLAKVSTGDTVILQSR